MAGHGIHHRVFSMRGTKKEAIPLSVMRSILRHVLDRQNHPLLIHCNHGKVRACCSRLYARIVANADRSIEQDAWSRSSEN